MDYQNKVMLITGAYRGIGKTISEYFSSLGMNIILTYHNHEKETFNLKNELINKYHNDIKCFYLDLAIEESIEKLYLEIKEKYGHIDILVNNASLSMDNDITLKTKKEFMNVLEVNVGGTFLMMKYFNNIIDNGYIFNISSTDGIDTGSIYSIDYNASKASINSLTKTFALYSNNTIISLCPNWVDTESTKDMDKSYLINEMQRINQKKLINSLDIAKTIDKCIKEKISSGSIIRIDG